MAAMTGLALTLLAGYCTPGLAETAPAKAELVTEMDQAPGNIAVTADGTVIVSIHPALHPKTVAVAIKDGKITPFPPGAWSRVLTDDAPEGTPGLHAVLGIRAGQDGMVWMISGGGGQKIKHLYAWDTKAGKLAHDFTYEAGNSAAAANSFFNDIALAPMHGALFLSDPAGGANAALIAVDMETGEARRLLEGDKSVTPEPIAAYINGKMLGFPAKDGTTTPLRGAVNPITIDAGEEFVYYAPMSGTAVYRVAVDDLLDESLSPEDLAAKVERYADKAPSAGITIDNAGNIYVTDIQHAAIGVTSPKDGYRILAQDDKLLAWPDGLSAGPGGPDGYVYVAANRLYQNFPSHAQDGPPKPPFFISRVKALAPTTTGR
jgi:sugar lactone lactonase YvrE